MNRCGIQPVAGVTVLGVDTALANVGWCVARIAKLPCYAGGVVPLAMGVIKTVSSAKKLDIRVGDDDFARSRYIANVLHSVVRKFHPRLITCESFSPPRNAAAVGKVGRCFGVLADISVVYDLPVLHATPMEIKEEVTGKKKAEKEEVQAALDKVFRNLPQKLLSSVNAGDWNHAYDALGAIVTCWEDEPMRVLRQLAR